MGEQSYKNQKVYAWDKKGSQDNVYMETMARNPLDRIPMWTNMGYGSPTQFIQEYKESTYQLGISDPSVFDLPSNCDVNKTCPKTSICTEIRGNSGEFLQ